MKYLSKYTEDELSKILLNTETNIPLVKKKVKFLYPIHSYLIDLVGSAYQSELWIFLTHCSRALRYGHPKFTITLNRNHYTASNKEFNKSEKVCNKRMSKLLERLDNLQIIVVYKGYYDPDNGVQTIVELSQRFVDMFDRKTVKTLGFAREKISEIRIKDMSKSTVEKLYKNGQLTKVKIDVFKNTRGIVGLADKKNELAKINKTIEKAEIKMLGVEVSPNYKRVFEDDLTKCGRFYGGAFQTMKSEYRDSILINGEFTNELDFKTCHPRILASMHDVILDPKHDFYAIPELLKKGLTRDFIKSLIFPILFCDSRANAIKAIANKIKSFKMHSSIVEEIIDEFEKHNHMLVPYFYNKNLYQDLQNKDSTIAEIILLYFANQDIPVLPYHDSFRIQDKYMEELAQVMLSAWTEVLGYPENCIIN